MLRSFTNGGAEAVFYIEKIKKSKGEIDKLGRNSDGAFKKIIRYIIEIILYYRFLKLMAPSEEVNYKSKIQDVEVDITNLLKTIDGELINNLEDLKDINIVDNDNEKINNIDEYYEGKTDEAKTSYLTDIFNSLVSFSTSIVSLEIALATDYGIAETQTAASPSSGATDPSSPVGSTTDDKPPEKNEEPIVSTQTGVVAVGGIAVAGVIGLLADRFGLFNE